MTPAGCPQPLRQVRLRQAICTHAASGANVTWRGSDRYRLPPDARVSWGSGSTRSSATTSRDWVALLECHHRQNSGPSTVVAGRVGRRRRDRPIADWVSVGVSSVRPHRDSRRPHSSLERRRRGMNTAPNSPGGERHMGSSASRSGPTARCGSNTTRDRCGRRDESAARSPSGVRALRRTARTSQLRTPVPRSSPGSRDALSTGDSEHSAAVSQTAVSRGSLLPGCTYADSGRWPPRRRLIAR